MEAAALLCECLNLGLPLAFAIWAGIQIMQRPREKRWEYFFLSSVFVLLFALYTNGFCIWLGRHYTFRLDLWFFEFSRVFDEPSFEIGRFMDSHPWLDVLARTAYSILFPAILLTISAYFLLRPVQEAVRVVKSFLLALLGIILYFVVPVSGPEYAFRHFPAELPVVRSLHPIFLKAPPNGFPSLHATAALLILFFAWRWKWGRVLGVAYLSLIVVSTMGTGEHYFLDILAAVPWACLVIWLAMPAKSSSSQQATADSQFAA